MPVHLYRREVFHAPHVTAPTDLFNVVVGRPAWTRTQDGLAVRCDCGKWMLLSNQPETDGLLHFAHLEVRSGGDLLGFACGYVADLMLDGYQD